jgi:two-component system LytT family sensor kinase
MDPEQVRRLLDGEDSEDGDTGIGNVHRRLRSAFGEAYGLEVATGAGTGTRVSMRVPKTARPGR